jgi:tetratricopeptide (TPR) repeat protein
VLKCLGFEHEEKILKLLQELSASKQWQTISPQKQAKVYYWLTILSIAEQDWPKDIDWLNRAISLDSKPEYKELLGDLLMVWQIKNNYFKNNYDEAKSLAFKIINKEKTPGFYQKFYLGEVYYYLGLIAFNSKDANKAYTYFNKSVVMNPWSDKAYLGLAMLYQRENKLEERKKILEECVRENNWSKECQQGLK